MTDEYCFTINYPVTVVFPDGSTVTANDEMELETIEDDYELANPDSVEEPTLSFPITITFEDGTTQEVGSEEELEIIEDGC